MMEEINEQLGSNNTNQQTHTDKAKTFMNLHLEHRPQISRINKEIEETTSSKS